MKKISLLKKVGMGIGTMTVSIPLVLSATSCSKTSNITTTYISFDKLHEDDSLVNMKTKHYGNDTILLGSDKFSDGNYILFVGSNTFDASRKFFAGGDYSKLISDWFGRLYTQSVWYEDVHNYPNSDILNCKFGFVTFLDNFDFKLYDDEDRQFWYCDEFTGKGIIDIRENISPFETWTDHTISTTKSLMTYLKLHNAVDYDWDDEAVEQGDYIRQDKQAKAYRSFCKRGLEFFPVKDDRSQSFITDSTDGSLMVIYKDGKLKEIVKMPSAKNTSKEPEKDKDTATLLGAINKYYADIEDDPE